MSPRAAGSAFVGRARELDHLTEALEEARGGRGSTILIGGEPGIGKSRLADELSRRAEAAGILPLWGGSWEGGGAPPFWPWVQAIRAYVRDEETAELQSVLGTGAGDIAQIVPEVRERLGDLPDPPAVDPDSARFRLFQAACDVLRRAAARRPILVVLEDLHSADTPSLLLLRFAARELAGAHVVLVATYRTTELTGDHPLAEAAADLARVPSSKQLLLGGLAEPDLGPLIETAAGVSASPDLVRVIARETEGNPLFTVEIVRLLAAENRLEDAERGTADISIPQGVREVIGRRLLRLSDECTRVLTLAAVLGRDFALEPLRRLSERPMEDLLEVIEEATAARVVADVPGARGWMRFSHALIRETLYEDLSATQRLRLHRSAGTVLEDLYAHDLDAHLTELAYHHVMAAPAGDASKAVEYARRAAEQALGQLAYEEAVRLLRDALEALELTGRPDLETRCELLVSLGEAQARAGDRDASRATYVAAAELAERLGLPDAMAKAAFGYGGRFTWGRAADDAGLIPLLESARSALGEADHPLRVFIMARLACALRDRPEREPRWTLSEQAVELARRLGDPSALAYALTARWASIWDPSTAQGRLPIAQEALQAAERSGDKERAQETRLGLFGTYLELGRVGEARAALAAMEGLARDIRQPSHTWISHASRSLLMIFEGRFDEAETFNERMFQLGRAAVREASWHYPMHSYLIRRERGGLEDVEPLLRHAADNYTWFPMFRCALAALELQRGRHREAAAELDRLSADRFAALPFDNEWLLAMGLLAEVIQGLAATDRAEVAYELLLPYAHLNAVGLAEGCVGAVSRPLGLLAMTLGRTDDAERHLRDALAMNLEMGALPWVAHTQHDLARVLLGRDAPGDRDRAEQLLVGAASTCEELGMAVLAERIAEYGAGAAPEPGGGRPATLRREGEYWAVAFGEDAFRLKDSKGLRYLARLLADPGREFHALDLVADSPPAASGRPGRADGLHVDPGGGTGPALDERAKAAYRGRLAELESEIDEADGAGDGERADRARNEREAIAAELSAAVGLGGRDREAGSAAERARVNVTRAIRSALGRIREESPAMALHLDRSVRTGTFCSYRPDPQAAPAWRL